MDRLSSCYFCGAALDATLEEHPVVPGALRPGTETQKTVVLCRTCQRKLDAVLDTVVDAAEANAGDVTTGAGSDGAAGSGDSAAAAGAPEGDIESTLGDDEEILSPLGDEEPTAGEAAEASDMEFGDDRAADDGDAATGSSAGDSDTDDGDSDADDGDSDTDDGASKARKYTRSRGAGFRKEDQGPSETGSLTGGAFDDDDDEDDTGSGSLTGDAFADDGARSAGSDTSSTESAEDPLANGSDSGSTGASSSDSGGDTGSVDESGGSSGDGSDSSETDGDHRVSMSRLENTKVMRLLENREFPVDKAEFVTVAANAYQVSQSDCEKVIDLAVEHDLLREENGQLYGGDA
jgi:hypothetical protein